MLEMLAYWNGAPPSNQHFIEITIPGGTSYEVATADVVPNWSHPGGEAARRFGRAWHTVVARMERNVVINTRHADFRGVTVSLESPVWWDQRLFPSSE